jgi:hypothetical protein
VKKVELSEKKNRATLGTVETVSDQSYTPLAIDENGVITWSDTSGTQDVSGLPTYYNIGADGITLKVVTPADTTDEIGAMTYTYTGGEVKLSGGSVTQTDDGAKITNGTIIKIADNNVVDGTESTAKYYIDVTDKFVTSVAMADTNPETQYVTSNTEEDDLVDAVTLTLGAADAVASTPRVEAEDVTSDLKASTTYEGDGADVKVKTVGGDTAYMYATTYSATKFGIVTGTSDTGLLSEADLSGEVQGLVYTDAKYTVKTVTAPTIAKADSVTGTAYETTSGNGKNAYDVTVADSKVSVAAPTIETSGATEGTWTYKWVDEVKVGEEAATKETTAAAAATLAAYETSTPGLHKVYVELCAQELH